MAAIEWTEICSGFEATGDSGFHFELYHDHGWQLLITAPDGTFMENESILPDYEYGDGTFLPLDYVMDAANRRNAQYRRDLTEAMQRAAYEAIPENPTSGPGWVLVTEGDA